MAILIVKLVKAAGKRNNFLQPHKSTAGHRPPFTPAKFHGPVRIWSRFCPRPFIFFNSVLEDSSFFGLPLATTPSSMAHRHGPKALNFYATANFRLTLYVTRIWFP